MFDERLVLEYFRRVREGEIEYVDRELKPEIMGGKAVSIVGPRRAGKTYYLLNLFYKHLHEAIYMDFESLELSRLEAEDVLRILPLYEARFGIRVKWVFLDEMQNLNMWSRLVRSLLNRGHYVFISGSSSKLLPMELVTELRGRTLTYLLLPFSFREFLNAKGFKPKLPMTETEVARIKVLIDEYLRYGGYPEVVFSEHKDRILREYMDTIFYRDFVERKGIKSIQVARILFEYLLQNFGNEVSIEKVRRFIESQAGISTKTTIYSYLDGLAETLSFFFLENYSAKVFKRKKWPKKVYVCDSGIPSILQFTPNMGRLMENVVFLELLRKKNENPSFEIYYLRGYGYEVDFVVKVKERVTELIQVTYASDVMDVDSREFKALLKASESLQCNDLKIITWDTEDTIFKEGMKIKLVPLWKWLFQSS
ncbi:MAG: ATP-binding protein [Candidatus Aminicenantes bacterium]|nr:ATP-binding protein [Candidatus Aminicenantes bacterium]